MVTDAASSTDLKVWTDLSIHRLPDGLSKPYAGVTPTRTGSRLPCPRRSAAVPLTSIHAVGAPRLVATGSVPTCFYDSCGAANPHSTRPTPNPGAAGSLSRAQLHSRASRRPGADHPPVG